MKKETFLKGLKNYLLTLTYILSFYLGIFIYDKVNYYFAIKKVDLQQIQTLSKYFHKVYTIEEGEKYLGVDRVGDIHIITYKPYFDEVIIPYGDVTEAITTKDVINLIK